MVSQRAQYPLTPRSYRFGEFEVDLGEETLRRDGERLNINRKMFQVLCLLIERRGDIVPKHEFFERVWGGSFVEDNNLTVTITALRRVLNDDPKNARFIENLPRRGYRFIAPVESASQPDRSEIPPARATGSRTAFPNRRLSAAIVAAFVVVALTIAGLAARRQWLSSSPSATSNAVSKIDSIAVLPFAINATENEYLADGLTDGIIIDLSRLSQLRVIDHNSAFQYKNKSANLVEAGRRLNVRAVVSGQIDVDGDFVVINAEMFDVGSNSPVWRQQFKRRADDLVTVQQEISEAIASKITPRAGGPDQGPFAKRPTNSPEAYELYLKARYSWSKRSNSEFLKSIGYFKQAIDKDPTFAGAYVGLAKAYSLAASSDLGISDSERISMSRGAIQRALEIDDSLGEAYAAIGISKCYYNWDLKGAESDYRRAVELNPNDATAHHWLAELLAMQGRFDESISEYDRAISLDPLSPAIRADKAFTYYYARDYDKALELLNIANKLDPDFLHTYDFLDAVYKAKGMYPDAIDQWEKHNAVDIRIGSRDVRINALNRQMVDRLREGLRSSGEAGYWRALADFGKEPAVPFNIRAQALSKLGENDKAFEILEAALNARYSGMVWLKVSPEFDSLRSDPRYQDLLRRVGFQSE